MTDHSLTSTDSHNATYAMNAPFSQRFPIKSEQDICRLEQTPFEQALAVTNTYQLFQNSARAFGESTALTFLVTADPEQPPVRCSYAELFTGITQTANLLYSLGIRENDVIAILLPNCIECHLALWGAEAAGIVLPLNPLFSDEKLAAMMDVAQVKALIAYGANTDVEFWTKALKLRQQVPTLQHLLRVMPAFETEPPAAPPADDVIEFDSQRLLQPGRRLLSERHFHSSDIAAYFHTGGTTGIPKIARHSHGAQVFSAWASVQLMGSGPGTITINCYPLFHVAGALSASLSALSAGVETVIPTTRLLRNRQVLINYWRLVEKYRATTVSAVPTVLAALLNIPVNGADISSLRACRTGAAPLPQQLADEFIHRFGIPVSENLGMTEMAGISTITPPEMRGPAGCVGLRLPYSHLKIVALDKQNRVTGQVLPTGQAGMVLFSSPNLFSGYLNPQDTESAFTKEGWLITGDIGFVDEVSRLHISGRAKDLIIRSGHNIDPKVIEDVLASHPAVQVCAAVGAPDSYAGEVPVAFAVLRPDKQATEEELLAFIGQYVDEIPAKPKQLTILDSMPVTNVGKVYKPQLRALAAQRSATELINKMCQEYHLDVKHTPRVELISESSLRVSLAPVGGMDTEHGLSEHFRTELARIPFHIDIQ